MEMLGRAIPTTMIPTQMTGMGMITEMMDIMTNT